MPSRKLLPAVAMLSSLFVCAAVFGETSDVTAKVSSATVKAGTAATLIVTVKLANSRLHINSNKPADPFMIATVVTPGVAKGVAFGSPVYPKAADVVESYATKPLSVYKGVVSIALPFTVAKGAPKGPLTVPATIKYQACDDKSCYPPHTQSLTAIVTVK